MRQVSRAYIAQQSFLENNFADFLVQVQVKIIKILPRFWRRFVTATAAIVNFRLETDLDEKKAENTQKELKNSMKS